MVNDTSLKRCSKCGTEYPETTEFFHLEKKKDKSGFRSVCKKCRCEQQRLYRLKNPEKARLAVKNAMAKKPELYRGIQNTYTERHRDRIVQDARDWRKNNPEKAKQNTKKWRDTHPEIKRAEYHRRRARLLSVGGSHTPQDVESQYKSQKGKCWWCGCKLGDKYHIDHRIPLDKGGSNNPNNICLSCPKCNLSKGAKFPWEWNGRLI